MQLLQRRRRAFCTQMRLRLLSWLLSTGLPLHCLTASGDGGVDQHTEDCVHLAGLHCRNGGAGNITYSSATFSHNKVGAVFEMSGEQADLLRYDVEVRQPWVEARRVEDVYPYILSAAPRAPFTKKTIIYTDDQVGEITTETIGWIIGAIGVIAFGVLLECCCGSNQENVVYEHLDNGTLIYAKDEDGEVIHTATTTSQRVRGGQGNVKNPMGGRANSPQRSEFQSVHKDLDS